LTLLAIASWKLPLAQYVRARYLPPSASASPTRSAPELHAVAKETEVPLRAADESQHADGHLRELSDAQHEDRPSPSKDEVGTVSSRAGADLESRAERSLRRRGGRWGADARSVSLQRQAVELVISGDFAGAEEAYRLLAKEQPDAGAFREAARILAARQRK
ncbi:MAG TPA: hypothetical protein VMF89_08340, partial [Polyangiales bacterium]|nr:hypothetical protein [Polyangiales bacterium]